MTDARPGGPPAGTTLQDWVKAALRDAIARGEYVADQPFVTQREVVDRFGVSTTTAIRALNDLVAEGLVVRRRGRGTFVAERAGRSRRRPRRQVVFVNPNETDAHQVAIRAGIAAVCAAHDRPLGVSSTADVGSEPDVLRRAVADGAAGLVVFARDRTTIGPVIEELRREGVPVVLVDRYLPTVPTDAVVFDDTELGYQVTRAVLDRGHRAVAALWGEEDATSVRDRLGGHYRALRERGLPELPERSALRDYTGLGTEHRRRRLRALLDSPDGLTAIIGGNASTMSLAASDLLSFSDGFPGSVELANMDQLGPYDVSPLAVVSATLPARELGTTATELLLERIGGSRAPMRHVVLPGRVHVADRRTSRLSVAGGLTPR